MLQLNFTVAQGTYKNGHLIAPQLQSLSLVSKHFVKVNAVWCIVASNGLYFELFLFEIKVSFTRALGWSPNLGGRIVFCYSFIVYEPPVKGLGSHTQFPCTRFFSEKSGENSILKVQDHPLPGPDLVPRFRTPTFPLCFGPRK